MILNKHKKLLKLLKDIPIFHGLDNGDYKLILPLLVPIQYPPDSVIIKQGDMGDAMYIIKKGSVHVTRQEKNMQEISLGNLEEGTFFGELSLIDNLPRSASVTSDGNTEIFRLIRHDFENLISQNDKFALAFYKNCLKESFTRFRKVVTNFTFSQNTLREKMGELDEIHDDLGSAHEVQNYFTDLYSLDGLSLPGNMRHSYIYKPCREVGGDFINIIKPGEQMVGVIMADVEGIGVQASLVTGIFKSIVSVISDQLGAEPRKFLRYINRHFQKIISNLSATCCYALFDRKDSAASFVSAGSIYPLYYRKRSSGLVDIKPSGPAFGTGRNSEYETVRIDTADGDKILFYTSGVLTQINSDEDESSVKKISEIFLKYIKSDSDDILESVYADMKQLAGRNSFDDDITLFLLEL